MRGIARKLSFALAATFGALLLLNGLAFLGELAAYGTWYADGQPVGLYRNAPGERPQLQPGARLNGLRHRISVNALGFRGPAPAAERAPDALRVWCLGGSTTFDIYAPDDETTWPALLQTRLQASLPDRTVEVLNAGIPGEILYGSTLDLQALGPQVRPDIVVVYHGPNDLWQTLGAPPERALEVRQPPGLLTRLDPALLRVATRTLQRRGQVRVPLARRDVQERDLREIRQRLQRLVQVARELGAAPVLATHAMRAPRDATGEAARAMVAETAVLLEMHPESAIQAFAVYNRMVQDLARSQRLPVADVRAAVGPDAASWGDATHFLPPGSALAAGAVAQTILDAGLGAGRPRSAGGGGGPRVDAPLEARGQ